MSSWRSLDPTDLPKCQVLVQRLSRYTVFSVVIHSYFVLIHMSQEFKTQSIGDEAWATLRLSHHSLGCYPTLLSQNVKEKAKILHTETFSFVSIWIFLFMGSSWVLLYPYNRRFDPDYYDGLDPCDGSGGNRTPFFRLCYYR